jgi:hypothetical protein
MKSILATVFVAAIPVVASAADFAGTWEVTYFGAPQTGPKTIGSMIFDFKIDDGKVAGLAHIGSWPGLAPIAQGKMDGDHISFTATGYLPSSTGIPTCLLEGTLSGDNLVIKLSTLRNPGGPGSGAVYEYRGGRLDAAAARTEKLKALVTLSVHRVFPGYPAAEAQPPADFDSSVKARASRLGANIARWEQVKPRQSEAESFTDQDLDDLIAFYNSSTGQGMIKAKPPAVESALSAFLAGR